MICKYCGNEIDENINETNAVILLCPYCNNILAVRNTEKKQDQNKPITPERERYNQLNSLANSYYESKTGVGVLMALFLGFLGLIIGLLLYPAGSNSRSTFLTSWVITTIICSFIVFLFYIIISSVVNSVAYWGDYVL